MRTEHETHFSFGGRRDAGTGNRHGSDGAGDIRRLPVQPGQSRETLAEDRFDLLILDVNLPDGSGLDLLRQIRAGGDTTPVILLTANDLELDEVTGLEAGADDYITKPFTLAVLRPG